MQYLSGDSQELYFSYKWSSSVLNVLWYLYLVNVHFIDTIQWKSLLSTKFLGDSHIFYHIWLWNLAHLLNKQMVFFDKNVSIMLPFFIYSSIL